LTYGQCSSIHITEVIVVAPSSFATFTSERDLFHSIFPETILNQRGGLPVAIGWTVRSLRASPGTALGSICSPDLLHHYYDLVVDDR
jgi:hypothetical protein